MYHCYVLLWKIDNATTKCADQLGQNRNCKITDGSLQSQGLFSWDTFNRKEIGMKLWEISSLD